jgi:hypothetical protein
MSGLAEREVQLALQSRCFDGGGEVLLDHADVVAGAATVSSAAGRGEIRVPVDVYVTTRDEVLGESVPAGATRPAGQAIVLLAGRG